MIGVSRRSLLRLTAIGAAGLAGQGCAPKPRADQNLDAAVEWAKAHLPHSTPDMIAGAAKEGHLNLTMLNLGGNPEVFKQLIAGFRNRYPFIAVSQTNQSTLQLLRKFTAEFGARKGVTDYLNFPSNMRATNSLIRQGAIMNFVISDDAAFPAGTKQTGAWYSWRIEYPATAWRKGALSAPELQLVRSYEGLGDPRFKNRIGMAGIENSTTAAGCYRLLREKPSVWQNLARNKPRVKSSGAALINGLLAGEYDVAMLAGILPYVQAARDGAPVEFGISAPFPAIYTPGGISALAPHPNAAKLWQDWVMSVEGQTLWARLSGAGSARSDIAEKSWARQQPWFFQDMSRQVPMDWDDFAAKEPDMIERFKTDMQAG